MATKSVSPPPEEKPEPHPEPAALPSGPLTPSQFDQSATWADEYRSMLDAPGHPLGHLKGV